MYDLDPIYKCTRCGHETKTPTQGYYVYDAFCPACGCPSLDEYYTCPGCGETKPEKDMLVDDIDLCKQCLKDIVGDIKVKYAHPKWKELAKYLEEVR